MSRVLPELRGEEYNSVEGSITGATTNASISFGSVVLAYNVQITNDSATYAISCKLNATANPSITIKAGETFVFNHMPLTALYLSNSSGNTVAYRIIIAGE